jgi:hypothetical protein
MALEGNPNVSGVVLVLSITMLADGLFYLLIAASVRLAFENIPRLWRPHEKPPSILGH